MATSTRKPQASLPSPAELLDLIAQRKAELPGLLKVQNDAAEQSVVTGDDAGYLAAVAAVTACNTDIARLQSAMVGATARTREVAEAQQRAVQAAARERVSKILDERVGTVAKIEAAIAELVRGWHELIEQSDRALVAFPNGPPPTGMALTNGELIQLLGAELFRQGATVPVTGRPQLARLPPTLPGPKSPDYMMIHQPEKITKLSAVIEQANNLARSIMEKKHAA
jgi:hypothetical protein